MNNYQNKSENKKPLSSDASNQTGLPSHLI